MPSAKGSGATVRASGAFSIRRQEEKGLAFRADAPLREEIEQNAFPDACGTLHLRLGLVAIVA